MEQCIICLETDGEIYDYEHTCGIYKVHSHCITTWLSENNCECLICRKKIITEEEEREIRQEYNIMVNQIVQPTPIIPYYQHMQNYPVIVYQPRNYRIVDYAENNYDCICNAMIIIIIIVFGILILEF
jgi:hypothetical protein